MELVEVTKDISEAMEILETSSEDLVNLLIYFK